MYINLYGDGLATGHMTNNDSVISLVSISQSTDGQRPHITREHISIVARGSEGCGQVSLVVPCDLCCHDDRVIIFDCNSDGDFSVDQSDHFGTSASGAEDRHSWKIERERERESKVYLDSQKIATYSRNICTAYQATYPPPFSDCSKSLPDQT